MRHLHSTRSGPHKAEPAYKVIWQRNGHVTCVWLALEDCWYLQALFNAITQGATVCRLGISAVLVDVSNTFGGIDTAIIFPNKVRKERHARIYEPQFALQDFLPVMKSASDIWTYKYVVLQCTASDKGQQGCLFYA
jgi:hypothetical protein